MSLGLLNSNDMVSSPFHCRQMTTECLYRSYQDNSEAHTSSYRKALVVPALYTARRIGLQYEEVPVYMSLSIVQDVKQSDKGT